jgi:hypothetical protein
VGREGTAMGLATLAKLLTATLLRDSTSQTPRRLALWVTFGFGWGCTALSTFRLGGQIEFGIIYIHTQLNTTVYVGITTKKPKKPAKQTTFPSPPLTHPPAPPPNITAVIVLS